MIDFEATRRLWEALETSRLVPGEGLASTSRSPVPDEVAQAFRDLMEAPDGVIPVEAASNAQPTATADVPGASDVSGVRGTEAASGPERIEGIERADSPERPPQLDPADAVTMSPTELYRLQVSLNMHALETRLMTGVRERAKSELETTVKSTS